jgi:hypothetical protein
MCCSWRLQLLLACFFNVSVSSAIAKQRRSCLLCLAVVALRVTHPIANYLWCMEMEPSSVRMNLEGIHMLTCFCVSRCEVMWPLQGKIWAMVH